MKIIKINPKNPDPATINLVVKMMKKGAIVIYPTDTCYGIGCRFDNMLAIEKISLIKGREGDKKYSVIIKSTEQAKKFLRISDQQKLILNRHLPGPFTFIIKKHLEGGGAKRDYLRGVGDATTLGIRIPDFIITRVLASKFNMPYVTTSANVSGDLNPYNLEALERGILFNKQSRQLIDLILDVGQLPQNPTSTVVDLTSQPIILRQGAGHFLQAHKLLAHTY